jgi:hypothetical protein
MPISLLIVLLAGVGLIQTGNGANSAKVQKAGASLYTNADLGLSYMPPTGLFDLTEGAKAADNSASRHDGRVQIETLLFMSSGPDDQAGDWVTIGISTFPRGREKDKGDDVTAGFITNHSVGGWVLGGGATTKREVVKIAGRDFSVSYFEKKEPLLTKYAIVYTVVHKEKFLSFFFAGNEREKEQRLAKSMDTLKFRP